MKHNYVWIIGTRPDIDMTPIIVEFDFILKEVVSNTSGNFIRFKKYSPPQSFDLFRKDLVGGAFKSPLMTRATEVQYKSYPDSTQVDTSPPMFIHRIYNRNLSIIISSVKEEEGFNCIKLLQMTGQI